MLNSRQTKTPHLNDCYFSKEVKLENENVRIQYHKQLTTN